MARRERILVVVDPDAASQPALDRAALLAKATGSTVELLACLHESLPRHLAQSGDPRAVRRALLAHQLGYLQELARAHPEVVIETRAVWDRPLHEAIIRESLRSEALLVMKLTQYQPKVARARVSSADWHLVRDCAAPLWLVRGAGWPMRPVVAAFVDPLHEHDKPAALDSRILRQGAQVASSLGGELHAVHCHDPWPAAIVAAGIPGAAAAAASDVAALREESERRLGELAATAGVPPGRVHLQSGAATHAIPAAARELRADLAVMGAISRSRLKHAFIGSTAERVLDSLACDVLVIKPERFESPETYRIRPADFMEMS